MGRSWSKNEILVSFQPILTSFNYKGHLILIIFNHCAFKVVTFCTCVVLCYSLLWKAIFICNYGSRYYTHPRRFCLRKSFERFMRVFYRLSAYWTLWVVVGSSVFLNTLVYVTWVLTPMVSTALRLKATLELKCTDWYEVDFYSYID